MSNLVKTSTGGLVKIKELAKVIASKSLASQDLTTKVAESLDISQEDAIELLRSTKLEESIHDELVNKITNGALAIKAFEVLQKKMEEGNLMAASMVIGFNKLLRNNQVKAITNLQVNSDKTLINLDSQAKRLLGRDPE